MATKSTLLTPQYIATVVVPFAILVGTALFKTQWLPIAFAISAAIGGVQFLTAAASAGPKVRQVLNPEQFQSYPLSDKTVLSHNTAIYRFKLPTEHSILGLPIGQHISIGATLDVTDPKTNTTERKQVVRSYTPVSSDNEPGHFDLLIKSYPTGNISKHFATLKIGDTVDVKGPKGAMVYTANMNKHIGMIAGGSGITPMLQVARAVVRGRSKGDTTQVDLIFANVNEEDILLRDDLDKLAREDDKFRVYYVLNNPPAGWTGGSGFVTPEMIKERFPAPSAENKVLICGPPPMVSAMKKATESLGYDKAKPVSKLPDQVFCF
ncbi:hypothetical protein AMS68_001600 [Peltaster fructicola]|uniref:NADH-cytochrome b5 reductase n=1 Tax=Peltaster fructicola TaxID=286661 RepID=A0A6H0XMY4_9PEZI|nr:hypothetical protein AMS68_001600 [Peltaster fructicola]